MAKTKKDEYGDDASYQADDLDDFNTEEEYQPTPLIAEGYYNAAVTDAKFNSEDKTIDWTFTLNNNGGVMSDGRRERNDQEGKPDKETG
jgi:hypothetical protein